MKSILIKGGRVIDPAANVDEVRDILIEDGKIRALGARGKGQEEAEIIDAKGLWVLPGLIDMHTHLRDPGRPEPYYKLGELCEAESRVS